MIRRSDLEADQKALSTAMFYSAHGDIVAPRLLYALMTSDTDFQLSLNVDVVELSQSNECSHVQPLAHSAARSVEVARSQPTSRYVLVISAEGLRTPTQNVHSG